MNKTKAQEMYHRFRCQFQALPADADLLTTGVALDAMIVASVQRIEEVRAELLTRVEALEANQITEASVENASETWNTCKCGHHGSAHDIRNRCLVNGCPCRCFSTIRKALPANEVTPADGEQSTGAEGAEGAEGAVLWHLAAAYRATTNPGILRHIRVAWNFHHETVSYDPGELDKTIRAHGIGARPE